jgi:hypothetical protein
LSALCLLGEVRIVDRSSKETLGRFGRPGRPVGMFTALHNISVDRQRDIFTSEVNTGQRVQKFLGGHRTEGGPPVLLGPC